MGVSAELSPQTYLKLYVSEVDIATVLPQLQPSVLVENINSVSLLEIQANNSIRSSAFKNLSE